MIKQCIFNGVLKSFEEELKKENKSAQKWNQKPMKNRENIGIHHKIVLT